MGGRSPVRAEHTYIATLVERQTRYVMLAKVAGKDTQTVVTALIKQAKKLPKELYKSLTWDRGTEMHAHKRFTMATDIQVYLRSPESLAARQQRKHQWAASAVSAQGHRHLGLLTGQTQRDGQATQRATPQDAWLPDARTDVRSNRCIDRLNPPP